MAKTGARAAAERLHGMKEACEACGLPYETLKFYCNKGLVPNLKRDDANRRVFSDRDIEWVKSLACLKRCGLSIAEMQQYTQLCLQGPASIPERKEMLKAKRALLEERLAEVRASIDYIDFKQDFYDDVLAGRVEYASNLVPEE
ncbi:MAG: MerR family transcriptional regulator [Coriobacteriales bacterium]